MCITVLSVGTGSSIYFYDSGWRNFRFTLHVKNAKMLSGFREWYMRFFQNFKIDFLVSMHLVKCCTIHLAPCITKIHNKLIGRNAAGPCHQLSNTPNGKFTETLENKK